MEIAADYVCFVRQVDRDYFLGVFNGTPTNINAFLQENHSGYGHELLPLVIKTIPNDYKEKLDNLKKEELNLQARLLEVKRDMKAGLYP